MKPHRRHRAKTSIIRGFSGPIEGAKPNPAARGGICHIDTCSCGAVRRTNVNQGWTERGPWVTGGAR